jgi:predicted transglutaminase-like protease
MGFYIIEYTETVIKQLRQHKKVGDKATLKKIDVLINELGYQDRAQITNNNTNLVFSAFTEYLILL